MVVSGTGMTETEFLNQVSRDGLRSFVQTERGYWLRTQGVQTPTEGDRSSPAVRAD